MKKIFAIALLLSMMSIPASAITTGNWDAGTGNQTAASAASKQWQEQQKKKEPTVEPEKPCLPQWILELLHAWKWW